MKTERAMLSQFVFVLRMRSNTNCQHREGHAVAVCVRSEHEKQQTVKTERAMLSQCCARSANERQHTVKAERAMLSQFCGRSENEKLQN